MLGSEAPSLSAVSTTNLVHVTIVSILENFKARDNINPKAIISIQESN